MVGLVIASAAHAAPMVPEPFSGVAARTSGSASILAFEAPPELRAPIGAKAPTAAVDGEGRNLSLTVPSKVKLYGVARADEVAARPVLAPAGAGAARLALRLDQPASSGGMMGDYVGVLTLTLDYN
jgi:hypothetical protein